MRYLYFTFFFILIILCCNKKIYAQPWTAIESGGLNVNSSVVIYDERLESLNGNVYAIWIESGLIRMKRYDGGTTWTSVDGGGKSFCSATCCELATAVYNNAIYCAWRESDTEVGGIRRIHVIRYDGTNWTFVQSYTPGMLDDGRHYISLFSTGYAYAPALGVHNGKLYASWINQPHVTFNWQVRVSEFDGTYWKLVDGGDEDNGLNKNFSGLVTTDIPMITMASYGNNLYAAWREYSSVNGTYQLRVKRYDGASSWTFIDGNDAENGLNYSPATPYFGIIHQPRLINYSGFLYAIFSEPTYNDPGNGYTFQLRWKKWNGSSWSNDDGTSHGASGTSGWNKDIMFQTNDPAAAADNNKLYVSWGEVTQTSGDYFEQIHVVDFDGTNRSFIDGNLNTGINYVTNNDARLSNLLIHQGNLYAAWRENPGSADRFRVKKYFLPPIVQSVSVPANSTYSAGQALNFTVNFSKVVNVAGGSPYIPITLNTGGTVNAVYVSGSGTTALVFRYTTAAGNADNNGISVGSSITLPGGCTLRSNDASPLDANLSLYSVGSTSSVLIDAVSPYVASINRQTPAGTPTNAASVIFRVTFNENVGGVNTNDFLLTTTETVAATISSVSAASGTTIDVTVNSISGYGTFRLDLKNSGTDITDNAGNLISGGFTGGQTYETPNAVISFTDGSGFTQNFISGSPDQVIGRYLLTSDVSGAFLSAVTIKLNGTRSGLTNLKLWSSANVTFESGSDTRMGSIIYTDPGDGNSATFSSFSSTINTSGTYYFLTADISASPVGTVQGVIVQNSSLTFNHGTMSGSITNAVISGNTVPLPVELVSFTASVQNNIIQVKWSTATEVNNYGFSVERQVRSWEYEAGSKEYGGTNSKFDSSAVAEIRNLKWEEVGFVKGNGNINSIKKYSFKDDIVNLASSLNHNLNPNLNLLYRLKLIDNDGTFKYSKEVEVNVNAIPTEFSLEQNYPNPFNPTTKIKYTIPSVETYSSASVRIKIYDVLGNEVTTLVNEEKEPGYYTVQWNASHLTSGIYFSVMRAGDFNTVKKMVLMK